MADDYLTFIMKVFKISWSVILVLMRTHYPINKVKGWTFETTNGVAQWADHNQINKVFFNI
jgi:hypothetical protein